MASRSVFLPPQVRRLAQREQEVAILVYSAGAITAQDVVDRLSADVSNGAVRSMLMRLVKKGILKRKWGRRGRSKPFIYMPAVTSDDVARRAVQKLSEQYFDGSLLCLARAVFDMLDTVKPTRPRVEDDAISAVDLAA